MSDLPLVDDQHPPVDAVNTVTADDLTVVVADDQTPTYDGEEA